MMNAIELANARTRNARNKMEVTRSANGYRGSYSLNRSNAETYKRNNGDWNRYYSKRDR